MLAIIANLTAVVPTAATYLSLYPANLSNSPQASDLNANAGAGIEIVQFNPKIMVYDVYGSPGSTAQIGYFDPDANVHSVNVTLPWSITLSTTLPTVSASLMARTDGDQIGCRVTVNGTVREEQSANGINAQTYCLVKSA